MNATQRKLVENHLGLARSIAGSIAKRLPAHIEDDDLTQDGYEGLCAAAQRYDGQIGHFAPYASTRVHGAILDGLRGLDWLTRGARKRKGRVDAARRDLAQSLQRQPDEQELADRLGWTLARLAAALLEGAVRIVPGSILGDDGDELEREVTVVAAPDPIECDERLAGIQIAIGRLPEREALVIRLSFFGGVPNRAIGETLGVTEVRICQLRKAALGRLRRAMR